MASLLGDLALGIAGSAIEHGIEYAGKSIFNKITGADKKIKEEAYAPLPIRTKPQNFKLPPVKVDMPTLDMRIKRTPPPSTTKPLPVFEGRREPALEMEDLPTPPTPMEPVLLGNSESRNILGMKQAIFYI